MSKTLAGIGLGLICLATSSALYFLPAPAQEQKGGEKQPVDDPSVLLGTWRNSVRHAVHAHLYQPVQGARDRDADLVCFERQGGQLIGYSLCPKHEQEDWNKEGRTDFREVKFVKGQVSFEFDILMNHGQKYRTKSKAWVRVEAALQGDRLIGRWRIVQQETGTELFRGEWEAWGRTEPTKK
jgi:hypothetical protein